MDDSNKPRELTAEQRRLFDSVLPFVWKQAAYWSRIRSWIGTKEDFFQVGCIGVLFALNKYQPERGYKFLTYAAGWIRQQMQTFADQRALIHIPRGKEKRENPHCIVMTDFLRPIFGWGNERQDGEYLFRAAPDYELEAKERAELVLTEMALLPPRWQELLAYRYGLCNQPVLDLASIGRLWGITRERVRQIEAKALNRIAGGIFDKLGIWPERPLKRQRKRRAAEGQEV